MDAWNDYVEWSGLDESKLAHPAGKGIPESVEVAEARMDAEAIALANSHTRPARWASVVAPVLMAVVLFGLIVAASMLGELVGGWTA